MQVKERDAKGKEELPRWKQMTGSQNSVGVPVVAGTPEEEVEVIVFGRHRSDRLR